MKIWLVYLEHALYTELNIFNIEFSPGIHAQNNIQKFDGTYTQTILRKMINSI